MFKIPFVLIVLFVLITFETQAKKIMLSVVTEDAISLQSKSIKTGKMKGPAAELVEKVLSAANIDFSTRVLPWARAYKEAEETPNTLIYSIVRNQERESKFHWLGVITKPKYYLFALKSSHFKKSENLEQYKKYNIGTILDSASYLALKSKGFNYIVSLNQTKQVLEMLTKKRVDFITANLQTINTLCEFHDVKCDDIEAIAPLKMSENSALYFAINKNSDPKLVNSLKIKYKELLKSGEISIF